MGNVKKVNVIALLFTIAILLGAVLVYQLTSWEVETSSYTEKVPKEDTGPKEWEEEIIEDDKFTSENVIIDFKGGWVESDDIFEKLKYFSSPRYGAGKSKKIKLLLQKAFPDLFIVGAEQAAQSDDFFSKHFKVESLRFKSESDSLEILYSFTYDWFSTDYLKDSPRPQPNSQYSGGNTSGINLSLILTEGYQANGQYDFRLKDEIVPLNDYYSHAYETYRRGFDGIISQSEAKAIMQKHISYPLQSLGKFLVIKDDALIPLISASDPQITWIYIHESNENEVKQCGLDLRNGKMSCFLK